MSFQPNNESKALDENRQEDKNLILKMNELEIEIQARDDFLDQMAVQIKTEEAMMKRTTGYAHLAKEKNGLFNHFYYETNLKLIFRSL